ncbi:MAG: nicotinamide riboside transporter PnuC [Pseudomonadota bacterium]
MLEYLTNNWLEVIGLISGLLCVWLLIKENYLTFPIGLAYSVITIVVVVEAKLFADVVLNFYFAVMNAYGWYFWLRGGGDRRVATSQDSAISSEQLIVARLDKRAWIPLLGLLAAGTWVMGWYFANFTGADLPYPDSFTTVASFIAMWMSARKYIESWAWWFVIDVIQIGLYLVKGIEAYAVLYTVYLGMAVMGWRAWSKSCHATSDQPVAHPDKPVKASAQQRP